MVHRACVTTHLPILSRKANDKKYLIAGDVTVTTDMKILDGGIEHSIINVLSVKPGDTLVLSKVQARI